MADQTSRRATEMPAARLEADAIGATQDAVIGMASSAPAATLGLTLAALASASAYGGGVVVLLTVAPMLVIANAYRKLNGWQANCGASFEWVGRAINPYLGFLTGWLMLATYVIGTIAGVVVLGPSVLAIFGRGTGSTWANVGIATGMFAVMLVISIVGIQITARTQVGMAVVEYAVLIGFAVAGFALVLSRHPGTVHFSAAWLSPSGIGGRGSLAAGFLLTVFMFGGWEGGIYCNEEVQQRTIYPGRAALWAAGLVGLLYAVGQVGLQGAVPPRQLQAHATSALVYTAQAIGGNGWAKLMALALALSVVGSTGTGIVFLGRIQYGMANRGTLPAFLGTISRRYATPVAATLLGGAVLTTLTWIYLLTSSVQAAFNDVIATTGLLYAAFYVLTALAAIVYYRRRVFSNPRDSVMLGVLPLGAAGFLGWVLVRSVQQAPSTQKWSLAAILIVGLVLMLIARFGMRSPFFHIQRESDTR
jgi:amino acid transporter